MSATAVALDQIVVTGTAGNQEVKAQSAVVATIDATDLMAKASILNVNELLYARTPGVSLTVASGASGANTRIDIRGQASISLSNNPLVFVDGVRITSGARGTVGNGVGGQTLNALNDINPEDIESIEIVKGPAAATLYGSDASAGVIQVLTKKGRTGVRRFSQRLTTEYDNIDPNFTPDDNYGICNTAALIAATSKNILCTGKTLGTVVSDNVLVRNGVFRNGWSGVLQYSAQGGGDNFGYYVSASSNNESGTQPGNFLNHRTARANFNWTASTKMSLDASIGLTRADDKLAKGDQDSFSYHAERRMGSARDERHGRPERNARRRMAEQQRLHRVGQRDQHRGRDDPRHAVRDRCTTRRSRGSRTASRWAPTSRACRATRPIRSTRSAGTARRRIPVRSPLAEANTTLYTVDYLGNINQRVGHNGWISSDLSFGTQWINAVSTQLSGTGTGLTTNISNLVSSGTTTTASQGYQQSKSFGYLGAGTDRLQRPVVFPVRRAHRSQLRVRLVGADVLPSEGRSDVHGDRGADDSATPAVVHLDIPRARGVGDDRPLAWKHGRAADVLEVAVPHRPRARSAGRVAGQPGQREHQAGARRRARGRIRRRLLPRPTRLRAHALQQDDEGPAPRTSRSRRRPASRLNRS